MGEWRKNKLFQNTILLTKMQRKFSQTFFNISKDILFMFITCLSIFILPHFLENFHLTSSISQCGHHRFMAFEYWGSDFRFRKVIWRSITFKGRKLWRITSTKSIATYNFLNIKIAIWIIFLIISWNKFMWCQNLT